MKTYFVLRAFIFCTVVLAFISCEKDSPKITPNPVTLDPSSLYTNDHFADLGRVLFYDTKLSVNNSISCGSCHVQALAFGDNKAFSPGFQNEPSLRNSPGIQGKIALMGGPGLIDESFFWDGRETDLSNLVLQPVFNHVEMGMDDMESLIDRLRSTSYYPELFQRAFHDQEITAAKVSSALASFIYTIRQPLSPRALNQYTLNALELQGLNLFNTKYQCNSCHVNNNFGYDPTETFKNIGLDLTYADQGRAGVTHISTDEGKFRTPELINVALTAPYMHDGRFETLDQVLDHYSHGIKNHPNLAPGLKTNSGQPIEMNFSAGEREALKAYLNAFTDATVIGNSDYSNPFKQ